MTRAIHLSSRAMLCLKGEGGAAFLNGLVTVDVTKLADQKFRYGFLLSPQGKFLHDFFLLWQDGEIWIDCEAERKNDLMGRLKLYKLKAKVEILELPDVSVFSLEDASTDYLACHTDPRMSELGYRVYGSGSGEDEAAYHHKRIKLAVPEGSSDMPPDKALIMFYGADYLNGVDFNKGCYVGQEVTARSKFRANLRKQIFVISTKENVKISGESVMAGERKIGTVLSTAGSDAIGLVNVEDLHKALQKNVAVKVGDVTANFAVPHWRNDGTS